MKQSSTHMHRQAGLSMVELMVAITLGLILLAGVIQIFASNKQTYRVQEATARVQENGRIAMQLITQDIRMADYWGCAQAVTGVINHLDCVDCGYDLMNGGITGTNNDGVNGSDTLTLQGAYGGGIPVDSHNVNAASFKTIVGHGLSTDDIVLASDCIQSHLMQVTNANQSTATVVANTGSGTPGNATKPGFQFEDDAQIYRLRSLVYSIQNDGTTGEPGLFRSDNGAAAQMLVEGVEDMQILFGEDTDSDRTANRYVDADSIADWNAVVSVRLNLTARTEDVITTKDTAEGDRRLRRNFTNTVTIRNRIVQR